MARWVRFTANHDHRWPSRARTAYKQGMTVFVKDEVAERAISLGRAEPAERPARDDTQSQQGYAGLNEPETPTAKPRGVEPVAQPDDADDVGPIVQLAEPRQAGKRRGTRRRR
jgi:hypothetical protein